MGIIGCELDSNEINTGSQVFHMTLYRFIACLQQFCTVTHQYCLADSPLQVALVGLFCEIICRSVICIPSTLLS